MVLFLAAARAYGFASIMEHPQEPSWEPEAPSAWKLPEIRILDEFSHVQRIHVDQCCLGAIWRKPTCLLAVRVPEWEEEIRSLPGEGTCRPFLGHQHLVLWDRGSDGNYRTAPAKTYGSGLCRLLATAAYRASLRLLEAHRGVAPTARPLPEDLEKLHVLVDPHGPPSEGVWSHDCARA